MDNFFFIWKLNVLFGNTENLKNLKIAHNPTNLIDIYIIYIFIIFRQVYIKYNVFI